MSAQCDGRNCASYNGACSFLDNTVYCGYTHQIERFDNCPKKQARLPEW